MLNPLNINFAKQLAKPLSRALKKARHQTQKIACAAIPVGVLRARHQKGFSTIAWLSAIPVFLIAGLIAAVIFYEGRKAYWDAQVKEMCAKDGGVTIYEQIALSKTDYGRLGGQGGMIPIPHEKSAPQDYPFVSFGTGLLINESSPRVYRMESNYLRRSDKKVLATFVQYSRVGGDFPLRFAHHSTFACPDAKTAAAEER